MEGTMAPFMYVHADPKPLSLSELYAPRNRSVWSLIAAIWVVLCLVGMTAG